MVRTSTWTVALGLVCLAGGCGPNMTAGSADEGKIPWLRSIDQALEVAYEEDKNVFVVSGAAW